MAQNDRALWNANIISALGPLGTGSVTVDPATRIFTITINWTENLDENSDGVSDITSFQTTFQL